MKKRRVNFTEIPILYSQQSTKMDSFPRYMDLLPEEIITDEVLMQAQYPDLLNFCQTSRRAARICQDEFFWKRKVRRDLGTRFPDVYKDEPTHTKTWKGEYKHYFAMLMFNLERMMFAPYAHPDANEVKALLDFGIDPNGGGGMGDTLLMRAVAMANLELAPIIYH